MIASSGSSMQNHGGSGVYNTQHLRSGTSGSMPVPHNQSKMSKGATSSGSYNDSCEYNSNDHNNYKYNSTTSTSAGHHQGQQTHHQTGGGGSSKHQREQRRDHRAPSKSSYDNYSSGSASEGGPVRARTAASNHDHYYNNSSTTRRAGEGPAGGTTTAAWPESWVQSASSTGAAPYHNSSTNASRGGNKYQSHHQNHGTSCGPGTGVDSDHHYNYRPGAYGDGAPGLSSNRNFSSSRGGGTSGGYNNDYKKINDFHDVDGYDTYDKYHDKYHYKYHDTHHNASSSHDTFADQSGAGHNSGPRYRSSDHRGSRQDMGYFVSKGIEKYRTEMRTSIPARAGFDETQLPPNGRYSLQKPMPRGAKGKIRQQQKRYVCCFYVDIDPEDSFVVVKRILGKHGNNMRRVAVHCESKIRLRGRGSGFLEGPDRKESDDPLQLHVSCVDNYENYRRAIEMITRLLEDIYSHYRRFCRQMGREEATHLRVNFEEVRRDDLMFNLLPKMAHRGKDGNEPGYAGLSGDDVERSACEILPAYGAGLYPESESRLQSPRGHGEDVDGLENLLDEFEDSLDRQDGEFGGDKKYDKVEGEERREQRDVLLELEEHEHDADVENLSEDNISEEGAAPASFKVNATSTANENADFENKVEELVVEDGHEVAEGGSHVHAEMTKKDLANKTEKNIKVEKDTLSTYTEDAAVGKSGSPDTTKKGASREPSRDVIRGDREEAGAASAPGGSNVLRGKKGPPEPPRPLPKGRTNKATTPPESELTAFQ
ncbi:unnamed protein product [Amoebophrya sp. A25]|nr:unnamed protein product [Amoebophrya sp. A25]|eukprot:GSA25T00024073001.1